MAWYNPTDPTQRNWMLGGIICLILVVPYYMYILTPRQEANTEVRTHVESLQEQNRLARIVAGRGEEELERRMNLYQRHVEKLEELVPRDEDVAGLIDAIASNATRFDVALENLAPEPPQPQEFYTLNAWDIAVAGEYHNVARFLTDIASMPRIVTPVQLDVQLHPQPNRHPDMEAPILATFRIETYVMPDQNAVPLATEGGS